MNILLLIALSLLVQPSPQDRFIRTTFTTEGVTLRLAARCEPSSSLCPFEAEIDAAPALLRLIAGVDYTYVPDRRTSPAPITDASRHFHFEGKQTFGENVYAEVHLRPENDAPPRTVLVKGSVPFAAEVRPKLPPGLRFEDKYWQQFLEGSPSQYYLFRVVLRGDAAALARIRSVEYHLPAAYFAKTQVEAPSETEYLLENSAPKGSKWDIQAVIRWRDGNSSTHALPFRPR